MRRNPEEGSTNNGIGWGENHLWGKDEDDLEKSKQESDEAEMRRRRLQKLNQKKDQTLNQAKKYKGSDTESSKKDKGSDTESSKKDKDPKTESSTKAKDPETQSGKPVVKPMVRVTENTSENSKVKKVDKYWDGCNSWGQKESYRKRKILSRTLRTWIIVVK
ncbi:hypothetical protein HYD47_03745 [Mycoplasmopsis bovis]|nr:hypothetical protein [Mycoplasmopsis bovis]QQH78071.1 hypothetical protein HYD47_03745 [Mycoplasmopsis bovis]